MKQNRSRYVIVGLIAATVTFIMIMLLLKVKGYAPFGDLSLAWEDANIQYLDLWAYFKDCLNGANSFEYTFSKVLGGSSIAILSYYLASPFMFLTLLVDHSDMNALFDLIVALKLAFAAFTCSVFMNGYFKNARTSHNMAVIILLSVSYALGQYSIAQASNIMWLDGVYMLPLILLGVRKIAQGRSSILLSVSVALSIVFNWYTGGMNCLYSIIWMIFEVCGFQSGRKRIDAFKAIQERGTIIVWYGIAMIIGVLLSAFLFLPTVMAFQNSTRGVLDWESLMATDFIGQVPSAIQSYMAGALSTKTSVSLFSGSFVLIGCIGCFMKKGLQFSRKVLLGTLAIVTLLTFYWNPLASIFSLLREVSSFWWRHSYLGIFCIVFLAANCFQGTETDVQHFSVIKYAVAFSALLILMNYFNPVTADKVLYKAVGIALLVASFVGIMLYCRDCSLISRVISVALASVLVCFELIYSAGLLMDKYHMSGVQQYKTYVAEQTAQIDSIQCVDSGVYRISQTSTRNTGDNNLTAIYNEGLSFGYMSMAGYTSAPEDKQLSMLNRMGYEVNGGTFSIINTSILPVDSLLGVKYVLSRYPINGLIEVPEYPKSNGKSVYVNPYVLPWAFTYASGETEEVAYTNPFEYQNQLYSQLLGEQVDLYIPVKSEIVQRGDVVAGQSLIYSVELLNGNYTYYGNLPWYGYCSITMNINDAMTTGYARWLSPSVFYIPVSSGDLTANIELTSSTSYNLAYGKEQFYALDLDKLAEISAILSSNVAEEIHVENGYVSIGVEAARDKNLYVSVPYDNGWTITRNGQEIVPELFAECMYSIPLETGFNQIEMTYHVSGVTVGAILTLVGGVLIVFVGLIERKWKKTSFAITKA